MTQQPFFLVAICAIYIAMFGEASIAKLRERRAPEWFINQFEPTWLAKLAPLELQYRAIMVAELVIAGIFVAALVTGEPWNDAAPRLVGAGLLAASGLFTGLLFGQRVSFDFAGAASSFMYASLSVLLWLAVSWTWH